jgi:hypothetical protein
MELTTLNREGKKGFLLASRVRRALNRCLNPISGKAVFGFQFSVFGKKN